MAADMIATARQLNRATLARQMLLAREPVSIGEAVRRVVALQAQEPASPYVALWNRMAGFDAAELDAALADRTLVKATLMRITLHLVRADDYAPFHAAMVRNLRASRLGDDRFTSTGLTKADADTLLPQVLEFAAQPRTGTEIEAMLEAHVGERKHRAWWALRTFAPLWHVPAGGPWSFRPRGSFVAAQRVRPPVDAEASVRWLVRRYLEGFGPASIQDVAQFALLQRAVIRDAVTALGDDLVRIEGSGGAELLDVPGAPIPDEDVPAPARFLPMWDSILLAYFDRSRVIPPDYRRIVTRQNGDVLPTLLVDGYVAGVWRPVDGGIEATAFRPLSDEAWSELASEAEALVAFLTDREPRVYARYGHWWSKLPAAQVRVLRGRA